ncbi:Dolichol phosphate-mannose biosynthesis regulatory protein [Fusarium oxysporum f. sp. albedinis]|nr:Dolichol phosphate-mannose biosynthesis regulatory protein [Fusarium oxysporum f. sp. albedinis]
MLVGSIAIIAHLSAQLLFTRMSETYIHLVASIWAANRTVHEVVVNEVDPAAMRRLCCLFWVIREDIRGRMVATRLMARDDWRRHVMILTSNRHSLALLYAKSLKLELPDSHKSSPIPSPHYAMTQSNVHVPLFVGAHWSHGSSCKRITDRYTKVVGGTWSRRIMQVCTLYALIVTHDDRLQQEI